MLLDGGGFPRIPHSYRKRAGTERVRFPRSRLRTPRRKAARRDADERAFLGEQERVYQHPLLVSGSVCSHLIFNLIDKFIDLILAID
jgi:hypothetical protein